MNQPRYAPLRPIPWDTKAASAAIAEIVRDALARFDAQRFWPAHPMDDGVADGDPTLYMGAAGMIWGLQHLVRIGATRTIHDFRPVLPRLADAQCEMYAANEQSGPGSLLLGDLAVALLTMRLAPSAAAADDVYACASANDTRPTLDLMSGLAGSMLACIFMREMMEASDATRWRALYERQAARLLSELEDTKNGPLWTQNFFGNNDRWLGPVHGYAGNMIPLIRGFDWLTPAQRTQVADAIPRTLAATVQHTAQGANWDMIVGRAPPSGLCQYCHGAPGMVTTFADAPFRDSVMEGLLLAGGALTWNAGPLAKGSNLCHGTGGNGYAFLKLYRRTGDETWIARAREFAMTAIAQCREARAQYSRGRYSLWTGDVGLAIYLWDCLAAQPRFPTVDVF